MGKSKNIEIKYRVQRVDSDGDLVEDYVDDMIFDDYDEAADFACECNSNMSAGQEVLRLSNPFDYEEEYGDNEGDEYIVFEFEEN